MKLRLLPILVMMVISSVTKAQALLENGGFESWVDNGGYQDPEGWFTLNQLTQFGIDPSATMSNIAHTGNKAVMLTTIENSTQNVPGLLCSGPLMDSEGEVSFDQVKIPFASRPIGITFAYMYAPGIGDTCSVYMLLTKWNTTLGKADTIGEARFMSKDSVATYTVKMIDFDYYNNQIPDSAFIIISASKDGFSAVPGSIMYVDDFYLRYLTGIETITGARTNQVIYPNPVSSILHVNNVEAGSTIKVFNALGVLALETTSGDIDVEALNSGVYYLVINQKGKTYTHKFVKQ